MRSESQLNGVLNEYRKRVAGVIDDYVRVYGYESVKHTSEIRQMLNEKLGDIYVMFQESDMCYNKTNKDNLATYPSDIILFEACEKKGYYRLLGQGYNYTGDVVWVKRKGPSEVVGHWDNGNLKFWGKV